MPDMRTCFHCGAAATVVIGQPCAACGVPSAGAIDLLPLAVLAACLPLDTAVLLASDMQAAAYVDERCRVGADPAKDGRPRVFLSMLRGNEIKAYAHAVTMDAEPDWDVMVAMLHDMWQTNQAAARETSHD